MENFTNSVLLPESLPEIMQEDFNRLNNHYLKIILIRILILSLLLAGGLTSFQVFSDEKIPKAILVAVIAVLAVLIVYSGIISILGFPKKGYF